MLFSPPKQAGKRVIAVGTTSVRSIESAALATEEKQSAVLIEPYFSDTSIFYLSGQNIPIGGLFNHQLPFAGKHIDYVGFCFRRI